MILLIIINMGYPRNWSAITCNSTDGSKVYAKMGGIIYKGNYK